MAGEMNCQFCSEVMDRFRLQTAGEYIEYATLGNLSDIIEMPCPHADSVRRIWERDRFAQRLGRMSESLEKDFRRPQNWSVTILDGGFMDLVLGMRMDNDYESSMIAEFRLILRPDEPGHVGTTQVLNPEWIDISIPRTWYARCMETHHEKCDQPDWMRLHPATIAMPEWLVDVYDYCVVECNSNTTRYFALSYTWGGVQCLKHTSQTIERLKKRGSLHPDQASDVPRTVRDAFEITRLLGERYLWVDSLCIPQEEETAIKGLNSMHHIYANSIICLIASAGTKANHGLRGICGVSAPRHVEQVIYNIADGEKLSWIPANWRQRCDDMAGAAEGSKYHQRGWTYQEYAFAKRRLIFTDGLLRWTCRCANWGEEAHGDLQVPTSMAMHANSTLWMTDTGPDLLLIKGAAFGFNSRYFTYGGDALRAFLGIQNHISRDFLGGLNYGHPEIFFDIALLWMLHPDPDSSPKRRLSENGDSYLPSWSWMGWRGEYSVEIDEEYIVQADSGVGFTQSVAQWYTMPHPLSPASDMQPVKCEWQTHRDAVQNGSTRVPFGWQRIPCDSSGSGHYYQRESAGEGTNSDNLRFDPEWQPTRFRYPIPLPPYTETCRYVEQHPFIFARTTRSFFMTQSLKGCLGIHGRLHLYDFGIFCNDEEFAGVLRLRDKSYETWFQVEVVAVVKGWTTMLPMDFSALQEERRWIDEMDEMDEGPHRDCVFVLWVKWEDGVAKCLGDGMVKAEIWERTQEPVDLTLG